MNAILSSTKQHRGPGRPREFDMDTALDGAMQAFREHGYHATSIADLCSSMQLTPGSIYKAFCDKRAIFVAVLDRYTQLRHDELRNLLSTKKNGYEKVETFLRFFAEASHGKEGRCGCLIGGSLMELANFDHEIAAQIEATVQHHEQLLQDLLKLGQSDGSIGKNVNVDAVARSLLCLTQGFRVVGKLGKTRDEVMVVVDEAMRLIT